MQDTGLVTTRQTDKSAFNNLFTFILPTKVSYQAVYTSVRLPWTYTYITILLFFHSKKSTNLEIWTLFFHQKSSVFWLQK